MEIILIMVIIAAFFIVYLFFYIRSKAYFSLLDSIRLQLSRGKSDMIFIDDMIAELPDAVIRYFKFSIKPGAVVAKHVVIKMKGSIDTGKGKWIDFTAEEVLSREGFVWKAGFKMGAIPVKGGDFYFQNTGRVCFRIFGIFPVVDSTGSDIAKSSRGRLVGEMFWLPSELLPHNGTSWEQLDNNRIQATKSVNGENYSLALGIDDSGKPLNILLKRWGDVNDEKNFEWIPYGGEFLETGEFDGYIIPVRIKAGWWYGTEKYNDVFKAEIESVKFL